MPTAQVCRRHGLSKAAFYKLKVKYDGMGASKAARLKALEDENTKLKRLLGKLHSVLRRSLGPATESRRSLRERAKNASSVGTNIHTGANSGLSLQCGRQHRAKRADGCGNDRCKRTARS
jgi:hypothetical protein